MEFNTKKALVAHQKVHESKPKKATKTKTLEPGQLTKKGGRIGLGGEAIKWSDGNSTNFKSYMKRMRQSPPEIQEGDKLTAKDTRALFKHSIKTQKSIKGGKLEVREVKEMSNGMTRYHLENNKMRVLWSEGQAFSDNKKSKYRNSHFITIPMIITKR